jgi:hypothetical protein
MLAKVVKNNNAKSFTHTYSYINYYKTHKYAHTWLQPHTHQKTIWIEMCLYWKIVCFEKLPLLGKNVCNKKLLVLKTHLVHKTILGKVESWCTIFFPYFKKIMNFLK